MPYETVLGENAGPVVTITRDHCRRRHGPRVPAESLDEDIADERQPVKVAPGPPARWAQVQEGDPAPWRVSVELAS